MTHPAEPSAAHPQRPSEHFAQFAKAMNAHAERSAARLAERHREEHDATKYHHAAEHDERTPPHG